jgi:hypothetical protein
VGAGFQDRWIKPLSHPSGNEMAYLRWAPRFLVTTSVTISQLKARELRCLADRHGVDASRGRVTASPHSDFHRDTARRAHAVPAVFLRLWKTNLHSHFDGLSDFPSIKVYYYVEQHTGEEVFNRYNCVELGTL